MKIKLLAVLLFLWVNADSQILISLLFGEKLNTPGIEFGLEGGINLSTIGGLDANTALPNLGLGFYFDIHLKNSIYLNTGLMGISRYGVKNLTDNDLAALDMEKTLSDGNYNLGTNYFMVPILIEYRFKNHLYSEVGMQAGLLYYASVNYYDKSADNQIQIKTKVTPYMNKIDVGAMAGIGYVLRKGKGMTIGVKYYYGFTNVIHGLPGTNNRALFVKANIPIGRQKHQTAKIDNDL